MRFDESIKAKGEVFITMKKRDKILFKAHQDNMIVDNGLFTLANLLVGNFVDFTPSKMGFGDSNIITVETMDGLQGSNCRIEAATGTDIIFNSSLTSTFSYNQARFYWSLSYNDNIAGQNFGTQAGLYTGTVWPVGTAYTVKEFALFTGNDTMFNRIAWLGVDLYMDTDMVIDGYFVITLSQIGSN